METLGAFLDAVTADASESEAVACAPSAHVTARLTRAALRAESRLAAKRLIGAGVTKGTRVGLLCPNRLDWLPVAFGALRLGALLVPFSTLWKRDEIAYGLTHGDVALLIAVPGFLKHDYVGRLLEIVPELATAPDGRLQAPAAPALRRVVLLDRPATSNQQPVTVLPQVGGPARRRRRHLPRRAGAHRLADRPGDDLLHLRHHRAGQGGAAQPRRHHRLGPPHQ